MRMILAIKEKPFLKQMACFLCIGLLMGLSAPGYSVFGVSLSVLAWWGLVPLFLMLLSVTASCRQVGVLTALQGMGFHAVYVLWLFGLHPLDWMAIPDPLSFALATGAWGLLTGYGGLLWGLLFGSLSLIFQAVGKKGKPFQLLVLTLAFPLVWVMVHQLAYQWSPIFIPWVLLDYTQAHLPTMRLLTNMLGFGAISGLLLFYAALLSVVFARWQALQQAGVKNLKQQMMLGVLALLPLLLTAVDQPLPVEELPLSVLPQPISVVQASLPIEAARGGLLSQSTSKKAYWDVIAEQNFPKNTLLVLPEEGVLPGWIIADTPMSNPAVQVLQKLSKQKQLDILSGGAVYEPVSPPETRKDVQTIYVRPTSKQYNVLSLFQPAGFHEVSADEPPQYYAKQRLVPFGETTPYLPGTWVQAWLKPLGIEYTLGFDPGLPCPKLMKTTQGNAFGGLICFELIFSDLAQRYKKQGAKLMVNSSNLGWFHGSRQLEAQFVAMGQLRAAETGLPVVIAENMGASAIIDKTGQILIQAKERDHQQHAQILQCGPTARTAATAVKQPTNTASKSSAKTGTISCTQTFYSIP